MRPCASVCVRMCGCVYVCMLCSRALECARVSVHVFLSAFVCVCVCMLCSRALECARVSVHVFLRVCPSRRQGLLPYLRRSADARVLNVFSAGVHQSFTGYTKDPSLRTSYTLGRAANAAGMYNDIAVGALP